MGKTRDLFQKIGDIREHFMQRWIGMIKDRNIEDLTKTEEIKKKWQEYTEELYKIHLDDLDNHGVITHLEPDVLDCKVQWILGALSPTWAQAPQQRPRVFRCLEAGRGQVGGLGEYG